jgi:cytochrome c oxidase subunit II
MTSTSEYDEGAAIAARIERRWTVMSAGVVGLLVGMAIFAGIHKATMPQAWVETANPQTLHISGEFVESNLGSAIEADGSVTVRAIGQQFSSRRNASWCRPIRPSASGPPAPT